MCGRYTIIAEPEDIQKRFHVSVPESYKKRFNAAPTQALPVITSVAPDQLVFFYWGLLPNLSQNKAMATKLINANADSLQDKISFRNSLESRRCIIPSDGFYEWKSISKKSKIPYRITLNSKELFSMAGLWERSENSVGKEIQTFTIITTKANNLVGEIHDRMPVMLTKEAEKLWLDSNTEIEKLHTLLVPYDTQEMTSYAVSSKVNNVANDDENLIISAPPADQFGNYSLFD